MIKKKYEYVIKERHCPFCDGKSFKKVSKLSRLPICDKCNISVIPIIKEKKVLRNYRGKEYYKKAISLSIMLIFLSLLSFNVSASSDWRVLKRDLVREVNYDFRSNDWIKNEPPVIFKSWINMSVVRSGYVRAHQLPNTVRYNHTPSWKSQYVRRRFEGLRRFQLAQENLRVLRHKQHTLKRVMIRNTNKDMCGYCGVEKRNMRLVYAG